MTSLPLSSIKKKKAKKKTYLPPQLVDLVGNDSETSHPSPFTGEPPLTGDLQVKLLDSPKTLAVNLHDAGTVELLADVGSVRRASECDDFRSGESSLKDLGDFNGSNAEPIEEDSPTDSLAAALHGRSNYRREIPSDSLRKSDSPSTMYDDSQWRGGLGSRPITVAVDLHRSSVEVYRQNQGPVVVSPTAPASLNAEKIDEDPSDSNLHFNTMEDLIGKALVDSLSPTVTAANESEGLKQQKFNWKNALLGITDSTDTNGAGQVKKHSPKPTSKISWRDIVNGSTANPNKHEDGFVLDSGEKCVEIPNSVISENQHRWKQYIIGQFPGRTPSPGALHAIVNGIWSNKSRDITVSQLSPHSFLIKIPSDFTRNRVLDQGIWHIEKQVMFVDKWEPGYEPEFPELKAFPVWIDFHHVPLQYYSEEALFRIASMIGEPVFVHQNTLNMLNLQVARVFTVVDPRKALPEAVNVRFQSGKIVRIPVSSPWLPPICEFCQEIGHSLKRCPTAPITCPACNSTGHQAVNCPNMKKKVPKDANRSKKTVQTKWVEKKKNKAEDKRTPSGDGIQLVVDLNSIQSSKQGNKTAQKSSKDSPDSSDDFSSGISDSSDNESPDPSDHDDSSQEAEENFENSHSKRKKKIQLQLDKKSVARNRKIEKVYNRGTIPKG